MSRKPKNPAPIAQARAVEAQISARLGNVAIELSLAAGQVLRDEFGFTPDQIADFQQKLIACARANRETFAADAA